MADRVKTALVACLLATTLTALADEPGGDPTRPPAGFRENAGENPGEAAPAEAPMQVNAVFLMGRHPYAVIDGLVVKLGERLGEGRVTRINETGVSLKTPAGVRRLKLLPEVEKHTRKIGEKP